MRHLKITSGGQNCYGGSLGSFYIIAQLDSLLLFWEFYFLLANMDTKEPKFNILFTKYVSHILENIFFSLDYN